MLLLRLTNLSLAFGDHPLLDHASLTVHKGERIGVLGPNGAGKSTFMSLLYGRQQADSGELWRAQNLRMAWLDQSLPPQSDETVYEYVASGLEGLGDLLRRFHVLAGSDAIMEGRDAEMTEMSQLQQQLDQRDGWSLGHRIDATIDRLALPPDAPMRTLSGGNRRRAALGRALISEPDLLMLDEPTNHLDIPTIEWLEKTLNEFAGTVMIITHDRRFLQNTTTRILELDRGRLRAWDCNYQQFLDRREQLLEAEDRANAEFDRKLAEEEKWIRQGIKARRTRNEGRVRALQDMREERQQRREGPGQAKFAVEQAAQSGKIVVEAEHIHYAYEDGTPVIRDFSTRIMRGDRIGFIGANGSGKTTLLKLLLGGLEPQSGQITRGSKLEVLYFDQLRAGLQPKQTVIDFIAEGREFITLNGKQRHVISYLQDFLFPPRRSRQPVEALSGGEQNRLILAKLFSKPANIMVLDEPTNDLDMETLELLEEILLDFDGTILLVSHDRTFLDNVVTSSIVFEGQGNIREYIGGYEDWLRQGGRMYALEGPTGQRGGQSGKAPKEPAEAAPKQTASKPSAPEKKPGTDGRQQKALQKALERVTRDIEKTEQRIAEQEATMAEPGFYDQEQATVQKALDRLQTLQTELDSLFSEWEELEGQR
ncbi:MAG: ATP-binding cassette domain-containing protein [Pseudohongiellaceae bacterium]